MPYLRLMRKKIQQLEQLARLLDPPTQQRNDWNAAIQEYTNDFLSEIETARGYVTSATQGKGILDLPFTETPKNLSQILQLLEKEVDSQGINAASGAHLGYIPGGGIFPTAMGDYISAVTNKYTGIFFASPGGVRIENQLIRWMCQLVGFPENSLGNLTSGGSIANLIAIVTARDAKEITAKKIEKTVIYLTEQVHHCVQKAIRIAGLQEAHIRYIPMDERYRMDADYLEMQVRIDAKNGLIPFLVVGSAGTTDVGAIDPLERIAEIAAEHNLWFHVDAAYGGFFLLTENIKNENGEDLKMSFSGIEQSDSVAIDPHKGFFLSYGLGAVLIKDVKSQMNAHFYRANYMQDANDFNPTDEPNPADLSPELTKHARGLRMWLPLHLFGIAPFRACLEEKILLARYFYEEVQKLGFQVGNYPQLSVVTYRYIPESGDANAFNEQLIQRLQKDGRIFVSSTTINRVFWIRVAILSFRTHLHHIDSYLQILQKETKALTINP